MAVLRLNLILLSIALLLFCCACGGGTTLNVQNQTSSTQSTVSIAFQPTPPSTVSVNDTAQIAAVVSNDSANEGVTWVLTCAAGLACGSLSSTHTASGTATIYSPPATLPSNSQKVTILAYATSAPSQNVNTQLTISAFASVLKGTYVLSTKGADISGPSGSIYGPYEFAGTVILDGNGNVTSGEQTYTDPLFSSSDAIIGGNYYIGPDGRGTLTLNTKNVNIGSAGIENFALVVLSSSEAFITKIDSPTTQTPSNESSSGTLELQTSTSAPSAGWAFVVNGGDSSSGTGVPPAPTAIGGVLNIDSPNTISGAGSVIDEEYPLAATLTNCPAPTGVSGTLTPPDSFGKITLNLTTCFSSTPLQFAGYIVDSSHIKLIETDINPTALTGFVTGGIAIGQGSATGTFGSLSGFSGRYVFGILGEDLTELPASLAAVAAFNSDGQGHLGGHLDKYSVYAAIEFSHKFCATYTIDPAATGRVDAPINFCNHQPGPEFVFYLPGNGNGPLVLDADANLTLGPIGEAVGSSYPVTVPSTFGGKYATTFVENLGAESDGGGTMTTDSIALTLTGTVDINYFNTPLYAQSLAPGSTYQPGGQVQFPGNLSLPNPMPVAFYLIDSGHGFYMENDSVQQTFGYFAPRTPVCASCP